MCSKHNVSICIRYNMCHLFIRGHFAIFLSEFRGLRYHRHVFLSQMRMLTGNAIKPKTLKFERIGQHSLIPLTLAGGSFLLRDKLGDFVD